MINIINGGYTAKCNIDEALRYMGVKSYVDCDRELLKTVEECADMLQKKSSFKACYTYADISVTGEYELSVPFGTIRSKNLFNHISGLKTIAVFCATIGIGADRLIKTSSIASPARAVIYDALASSLIENWCDYVNGQIVGINYAKSRFSPGYGDFAIEYQKNICDFLNTYKNIGVSVTDYMMMTPSKSVTAVIGMELKK